MTGIDTVYVATVTVAMVTGVTARVEMRWNKSWVDSWSARYSDRRCLYGWSLGLRFFRCWKTPYYDTGNRCYDNRCCNRATGNDKDKREVICWTRQQYKPYKPGFKQESSDVKWGQNLESETEAEAMSLRLRPRSISWRRGQTEAKDKVINKKYQMMVDNIQANLYHYDKNHTYFSFSLAQ